MGVHPKLAGLVVLISLLLVGCAAPPSDDRARARAALDRLTGTLGQRPLHITVSPSDRPAAYAWPDGRLLLTRGLLRLLDDDELAAAVAHELGHLVTDGHLREVVALGGAGSTGEAESLADAAGSRLLARAGYSPETMPRMLEKVAAAPSLVHASRESLRRRASALRHRGATRPSTVNAPTS